LGKNGQVGWELQRSLAPLGQLVALDRSSTQACGDLTRLDDLAKTIRDLRPQIIVNAAAHTAVDKAETERDLAFLVNAKAPEVLAKEAQSIGAWLVHYSTDYVFDGSGDHARTETAATGPLSVYGASKLAGEQAIMANCQRHLIFRTSWVYGARGANFARTMIKLAQTKDELKVINDQTGAPTGADLIADVTALVLHSLGQQTGRDKAGIYHLVATGQTNWFEYAKVVLNLAKAQGIKLKVAAHEVKAISTLDYPTPATRPLNSRLATDKLQKEFSLQLPDWRTGVEHMFTSLAA
jgi:dTDP-4-dehydrorhamnose reductase